MFHLVAGLLLTLIFGLPVLGLSALASALPDAASARGAFLVLSPVLYALGFVFVAGLASTPFHGAIVPGLLPRDLGVRAYRARRYYGLCWTAVYYFTPIYWMCLSVPVLKRLLFRLFGYRGTMNFVVYPDTWIRDLPLLEFGEGAYVANKATLGTNVCLNDGTILVDRVSLGKGTMVGHLSMLAPGVVMEEAAEIGVGVALGMKAHLGPRVTVAGFCSVNHLARLDEGATIGTATNVGAACRIGASVRVPAYATVPNRARWSTQDIADRALTAGRSAPLAETRPDAGPVAAGPIGDGAGGASRRATEPERSLSGSGGLPAHWNAFE